jgi:hypothetical protein
MILVDVVIAERVDEVADLELVTCAIMCVSSAYELMLKGTPRNASASVDRAGSEAVFRSRL